MSMEELHALVREHRASRRSGTSSEPGKSKPKGAKAKAAKAPLDLNKLSKDEMLALLATLQKGS